MATVKGQTIPFAIGSAVAGLVTQRFSVTKRCEVKEARNKSGEVVAAAFYRNTTEITVEGLGSSSVELLGSLTVPTGGPTITGAITVEELTQDASNEDWVKTSMKAIAYDTVT